MDSTRQQYRTDANLNTRIAFHANYSVNRQGFMPWLTEQYAFPMHACVLDVGCGTGKLWTYADSLVSRCKRIMLTDLSEGMLRAAQSALGTREPIAYRCCDVQSLPFADGSFDVVLANMMLYHVPDQERAFSEIRRVLKPDGVLYAATYGENGIASFVEETLHISEIAASVNRRFTLQNGAALLRTVFPNVQRRDYPDALAVTNADDLIAYIESLGSVPPFTPQERETVRAVLQQTMQDGVLHIPKEYGTFVARLNGITE